MVYGWGSEWFPRYYAFYEVKSDKKYGKDYMKSRCTTSDYGETCAKFQKDQYKIVLGVVLTRYPLSIY